MTKAIGFSKSRFLFMGLSVVLIAGMFVLGNLSGGFNLGVEFSPGFNTRIQVADPSTEVADIRAALDEAEYPYSTAISIPRYREKSSILSFKSNWTMRRDKSANSPYPTV
jgi:preprotein translocase subunit SecF